MALSARKLSDLLGWLYDVALEGERWDPFLEEFSDQFDAPIAILRARSHDDGIERATVGIPQRATARYVALYSRANPVLRIMRQTPPLTPVLLPEIGSHRMIAGTEYYAEYLRPIGCRHMMIVWTSQEDDAFVGLALMRSRGQAEFDRRDAAALTMVARHLERANRARIQMRELNALLTGASEDPREVYRFTTREADVAALVAQGLSIDAMALSLGMGRETVKSHLRNLYQKTHTHNQAQLMYLLLRPRVQASPGIQHDLIGLPH
ncbi:MAG: helix-turn-helix transcriptional regulator [Bauldia sp.]|nr:helix-turn-helix transcriptional regulator [Bauldia sp.]